MNSQHLGKTLAKAAGYVIAVEAEVEPSTECIQKGDLVAAQIKDKLIELQCKKRTQNTNDFSLDGEYPEQQ